MENKNESKEEDEGSSSWAARWVTATAVDIELEVLDCPICYRPLKPPVFQCAVGHVVCSCCCAKLAGRSCHTCGAATSFISRCFALEHVVESVRVPCANAGRGCTAKTPYHGKEEHEKTCPHAAEVKAVTTGPAIPADGPEQGGNRGRALVAGLVVASIPAAITVVRSIIKHFSVILTVRTQLGRDNTCSESASKRPLPGVLRDERGGRRDAMVDALN